MENTTKKSTTSENCDKHSDITTQTSTGIWEAWNLPAALAQESECSVTPSTFLGGPRGDRRTVDKLSQIVNYKTN